MIHSKATAVLMRLKEMDRKYKIKHKEDKRTHSLVSTESSLENSPKSNNSKLVRTFLSANEENEIASKVVMGLRTILNKQILFEIRSSTRLTLLNLRLNFIVDFFCKYSIN